MHVAAAPGAGKTVLGIEAFRRLGRPALVLAPTVAIRDQWLQRLRDDFLAANTLPDWVSCDLLAPGWLTASTYQGLFAATRKHGTERVLDVLHGAEVGTLLLDEAHHLRQQWWQCLIRVKQKLHAPHVVALTGTPPYDVPQQEWNRYIRLCGPIDCEVAVPELVQAGNLCPHQDLIHFSTPTDTERAALEAFDASMRRFLTELMLDVELVALLKTHPWVVAPEQSVEASDSQSDYLFALLLFLGETAPESSRPLLRHLDLVEVTLPAVDLDWAEVLLDTLLFDRDPHVAADAPPLPRLTRHLRQLGAVKSRRVYLRAPPHLRRAIENSHNKCASIAEVVEQECHSRPAALRALVLCDRIEAGAFPQAGDIVPRHGRLGVVPVFEHLRRLRLPGLRPAVLTGSLVVLPADAAAALAAHGDDAATPVAWPHGTPLAHDPGFHRIDVAPSQSGLLVSSVTQLFERGEINLLVGTAALLGEGWDAPALDTLILATTVRSAMLGNQMRGRALRAHAERPHKMANIWHLACVSPQGGRGAAPGSAERDDVTLLARRFRSFAGVSADGASIENGMARLGLDQDAIDRADCSALNSEMMRRALDRALADKAWRGALHDRSQLPRRMVVEVQVPVGRTLTSAWIRRATRWGGARWLGWWRDWLIRRTLTRMAEGLLEAMRARGLVKTSHARVDVVLADAGARCRLRRAEPEEEALFAEHLREMFDMPDSPRYLLRCRQTYYVVPGALARRRDDADALHQQFTRRFGPTELIFARRAAGRAALLKAKSRWLASRFTQSCESRAVWD